MFYSFLKLTFVKIQKIVSVFMDRKSQATKLDFKV